jgi:hypothetical protein
MKKIAKLLSIKLKRNSTCRQTGGQVDHNSANL